MRNLTTKQIKELRGAELDNILFELKFNKIIIQKHSSILAQVNLAMFNGNEEAAANLLASIYE